MAFASHKAIVGAKSVYAYFIYIHIYMSRRISLAKSGSIDWKGVGRRIRELRGFDITQSEFAERVGISQSYLSTVERGHVEAGAEVLLAISRESKKSLEWLLTGEG